MHETYSEEEPFLMTSPPTKASPGRYTRHNLFNVRQIEIG
jgi:hypothetical protein